MRLLLFHIVLDLHITLALCNEVDLLVVFIILLNDCLIWCQKFGLNHVDHDLHHIRLIFEYGVIGNGIFEDLGSHLESQRRREHA